MDLFDAIKSRRSIRAFKPDPVPQEVLRQVLDIARWSPSWENVQPWEVTIVGGEVMSQLKRELVAVSDQEGHPEIPVQRFPEPYLSRRRALGHRIVFDTLKIAREDMERRRWWRLEGLSFFHAPSAFIVCIDRSLNSWSVFDAGMFCQTLMMSCLPLGLGTCIQAAPVMYPEVMRRVTGIPESKLIVIAIAVGYPELQRPVNQFDREREPVERIATWVGF